MVDQNKQKSAIAKWLMNSSDPASSSFISNRLDRALSSPKLGDIETFASASFTQAELSELGIPEDILGKAQARAQEFIGNRNEAYSAISNNIMSFTTSEQFESAMSMIDRTSSFDQKLDTTGWAQGVINRASSIDIVSGQSINPTNIHNLKWGKPSEAKVTVRGQGGIETKSAWEIARGSATKWGYQYEGEVESDAFGAPTMRFSRERDGEKSLFDLTYESQSKVFLWGEANSPSRMPFGRSVQAAITGSGFDKAITGLDMLEPGDAVILLGG